MKISIKTILIVAIAYAVCITFGILFFSDLTQWINTLIENLRISKIIANIILGLPLIIAAVSIHMRNKNHFKK